MFGNNTKQFKPIREQDAKHPSETKSSVASSNSKVKNSSTCSYKELQKRIILIKNRQELNQITGVKKL